MNWLRANRLIAKHLKGKLEGAEPGTEAHELICLLLTASQKGPSDARPSGADRGSHRHHGHLVVDQEVT